MRKNTVRDIAVLALLPFVIMGTANSQEKQVSQLTCLTNNIYHEARGEGKSSQRAVAWVTLNRVKSKRYPNDVCGVVHQAKTDSKGNPRKNQCQFSWYCDGKSDKINDYKSYDSVGRIAFNILLAHAHQIDPTDGATMYHASYVEPSWKDDYEKTVQIDTHIFYK